MEISRVTMKKLMALIAFAVLLLVGAQHLREVLGVLGALWGVFSPLTIGLALAFVLNVPMRGLEGLFLRIRKPKKGKKEPSAGGVRAAALLGTFVLLAVVIALLVLVIVPQLAESVKGLVGPVRSAFTRAVEWGERQFAAYPEIAAWLGGLTVDWKSLLGNMVDFVSSGFGSVVSSTISATKSVAGAVSTAFVALVFAIYVLLQKEKLGLQCRKTLYALLPKAGADRIVEVCRLSHRVFSSFITGQCVEAVILGAMFFVVMTVIRMPYALLVGCFIAVTALIPIVGAFIGCAVGAFLLLMISPMQALAFVVLFLVLQQVEGNLIYPHVVGSSVGLPSIWVLAAVSTGGSLMGVAGMLLFIPLTSVVYTLFRQLVYQRLKEKGVRVK
ncbi:MAG: AI-2E family transporter [Oscillospiraceae bacterium]|nr:AI-2E family transporter [Oscillospiraceae bacterium]